MKYLKYFQQNSAYQTYKESDDYILPNVSYVEETKRVWYDPWVNLLTVNYLTIEALEDGLTASLSINACEYCVDGDGNWKSLAADTATESINTGHTLSFRGNLTPNSSTGIGTFTISEKCNLKGNCMSMLFGDNAANNFSLSGKNHAFRKLFQNCTNVINVSSNFLPATTLASNCYDYMFNGCTSLTTAPELPATTLENSCYYSMFENCTNLTNAPTVLPAAYAYYCCYSFMFNGCTSLTTAPELHATTLADKCYKNMFDGCTKLNYIKMLSPTKYPLNAFDNWVRGVASTGTFVKLPDMTDLPIATSTNTYRGIPEGWTVVNEA